MPWAIISLFGFLVCFITAPVVQAGILLVTLLIWPYVRQRIRTLETLRRGGTLVVGPADGRARMLGALRCGRQWVGCRGGHRGDLLGAFSHTLRAIPDRS